MYLRHTEMVLRHTVRDFHHSVGDFHHSVTREIRHTAHVHSYQGFKGQLCVACSVALWLVCHFGLVPPTFLGSVEVSRDRHALRFVTRVLLKLVSRTLRTSLQGARASDFGRTDSSVTGSDSVYVPWGDPGSNPCWNSQYS